MLISIAWAIPVDPQGKCEGEMIEKVESKGLRSLKISEIPVYMKELKTCEDKERVKAIKKRAEEKQLAADAENSKTFVGRTSGYAYCVMALFVYLVLVRNDL
ncbi:hypothetical protein JYT44_02185 [Caldithrix abyssi]|nr:hypothetical protein [Caldithrix abyssi]